MVNLARHQAFAKMDGMCQEIDGIRNQLFPPEPEMDDEDECEQNEMNTPLTSLLYDDFPSATSRGPARHNSVFFGSLLRLFGFLFWGGEIVPRT